MQSAVTTGCNNKDIECINHRRNNHGVGETSPPQLLGWGDQQCIGPLNFLVECSVSSLRRLKTYLRNSRSQQRLNHLAVLHVHRDRLYNIDIDVIAREFVAKSENRLAIFGRIWIVLHFVVPELAASHTRTFSETELGLHYVVCDITTSTWNTMHAIYEHL